MKDYVRVIEDYIKSLDSEAAQALHEMSKVRSYKKGDFLLREGQVCRESFLFISGIGRKYFLDDGKEHTTDIYFRDDLALSFRSYTLQEPGTEYIQAISDVTVSVTDRVAFDQAKGQYPSLVKLDLLLVEYYALTLEQKWFKSKTLSATERYLEVLERNPAYVQQIPLTILASFLGISLETLSRIRAKI